MLNQHRIEERRDAQSIVAGSLVPLAQQQCADGDGVRRDNADALEITESLEQ